MIRSTLHNHTHLCDGMNSAEEMAEAALKAGFTDFGFSGHAPAFFDEESTMRSEEEYIREILRVRELFKGRVRIHLGVEQEYLAPVKDRSAYDYIIGSIHNLKIGGRYYTFDWTHEMMEDLTGAVDDAGWIPKQYYAYMMDMILVQKPDIIGHFDLVTKLNADEKYFKEDREYRRLALEALDVAIESDSVIEVNAAGFRYRPAPYPDKFLLERIFERGKLLSVQADAHRADAIVDNIAETVELLREIGFRSSLQWIDGQWREIGLEE